jgi:beta-galactosidase
VTNQQALTNRLSLLASPGNSDSMSLAEGSGLLIEGAEPLSVNMLPWNAATIQNADDSWQLPEPESIHLNVDLAQLGVGGDSSWGAIAHAPYQLKEKSYSYRYRVTPIVAEEKQISLIR